MTIIDLPMPPSVNSIWRYRRKTGRAYLSPKYQAWRATCDKLVMANRKAWLPIKGHFTAEIVLSEKQRRGDGDNRTKAILDFCQRAALIENDSLCDSHSVKWGDAPVGCRVSLREV